MQDLRLVGIHEDGQHVLLSDADGQRYQLPLDDALKTAVRRERPLPGSGDDAGQDVVMRPRDVQGLIRAGVSVEEVAERSGWTQEKVRRYEPPIRAERDYVAGLARAVQLRGRTVDGVVPTLGQRAATRLEERGVAAERVSWDSWKGETGLWTVVCLFPAGGRERRATWHFDPRDKALGTVDDEARWISEDEQAAGGVPAPAVAAPGRGAKVYDVEAEGGLQASTKHPAGRGTGADVHGASASRSDSQPEHAAHADTEEQHAALDAEGTDKEPLDLMSAMRQRSASRRKKPRRRTPAPTDTPISAEDMPEQARPVEQLAVDTAPPPLGSHADPASLDAASRDEDAPAAADEDLHDELGHDPATGTADLFTDLGFATQADGGADEADPDGGAVAEVPAATPTVAAVADESAVADPADEDVADSSDPSDLDPVEDADGPTDKPGADGGATTSDDGAAKPATAATSTTKTAPSVPERQSGARRGRPAVPSWDDIMFGGRSSDR